MKDSFFDTSVIIHYGSHSKHIQQDIIVKKCYDYIIQKKGKYFLCYYVESEIKNRVRKRRIIYDETIRKMKDPQYEIGSSLVSKELKERDLIYARKIYELHRKTKVEEVSKIFAQEHSLFERKLDQFLKFMVDEKLIPINSIKEEIISVLHEFFTNYADCKVLASAFQAQEGRANFYLVAADKYFDEPGYAFIKEDSRMKKYQFPELCNLLNKKIDAPPRLKSRGLKRCSIFG